MMRYIKVILMVWLCCLSITTYGMSKDVSVVIGDGLATFSKGKAIQIDYTNYAPVRELGKQLGLETIWEGKVYLKARDGALFEVPAEEVRVLEGLSYIPIKYAAALGGYEIVSNNEGNVLRLKRGQVQLSDETVFERYKVFKPVQEIGGKKVYLTFDDGPNAYTNQLLDVLGEYDFKATFFMIEGQMKKYPDVVKRMVDEGHAVALHGVTHDKDKFYRSATSPVGEMNQVNQTLKSITGTTTKLTRMPYGSVPYLTDAQMNALVKQGYKVWDWQVDSRDWANKNGKKTYEYVVKDIKEAKGDGMVILFHDSKYTVETIKYLSKWLSTQGYTSFGLNSDQKAHTFKK